MGSQMKQAATSDKLMKGQIQLHQDYIGSVTGGHQEEQTTWGADPPVSTTDQERPCTPSRQQRLDGHPPMANHSVTQAHSGNVYP